MSETDESVLTDDLPPPAIIQEVGNTLAFTLTEAARIIALPGQEIRPIHARLTGAAERHIIHTLTNTKPEGPRFKLSLRDIGTAATIFALYDMGICDLALMRQASVAMYNWSASNPPPPHREHLAPVEAACAGVDNGEFWVLRLANYQDDQTHNRQIHAHCYNADGAQPAIGALPESYIPRVAITVCLAPILLPILTRVLRRARGN